MNVSYARRYNQSLVLDQIFPVQHSTPLSLFYVHLNMRLHESFYSLKERSIIVESVVEPKQGV